MRNSGFALIIKHFMNMSAEFGMGLIAAVKRCLKETKILAKTMYRCEGDYPEVNSIDP